MTRKLTIFPSSAPASLGVEEAENWMAAIPGSKYTLRARVYKLLD